MYLILMQKKDGTEGYRKFDKPPTDEELNQMARDFGWTDGEVFPDFGTFSLEGGGGGPHSGLVGEKWQP